MEKIVGLSHSTDTLYISLSRLFERIGYYGLRSLFILYVLDKFPEISKLEALTLYGFLTTIVYSLQAFGGFMGDLVIGNKNAALIGNLIQVSGALVMIIPNLYAFYTGVILFAIGAGFFTPNIIATLGKIYVDKQKLLNSALTWFLLAVNIGAFIGSLIFSIVALKYGWEIGFLLGALSNALAFLFLRLAKYQNTIEPFDKPLNRPFALSKIVLVILLSSLFWFIFSSIGSETYLTFNELVTLSNFDYGSDLYIHATLGLFIPLSLIIAFLWRKYTVRNSMNLLIAFGVGAIGLFMLFMLPEKLSAKHINNFVIYLICFGLAEVILVPVILTVIFKNTNPRYYASAIGVMFLVVSFAVMLSNKLVDGELNSFITFGWAAVLMGSTALCLLIYSLITRFKAKSIQSN